MSRLRAALGGIPRAARWCALIAFLNAVVWSFVTPPFQAPDENGHVTYVQYLAETGDVPDKPGKAVYSEELATLINTLRFDQIVGRPRDRAIGSETLDEAVRAVDEGGWKRVGEGGSISSSPQPPLFYTLEAGIYLASPWDSLVDRLYLMRLLSALLAALTTLFTFMFLREVFRDPWVWAAGSLVVAFQPLFGFISSSVTPDSLLFAASAGLLFGLARGFNRGLTPWLGAGIGAALAVGMLAKLNFMALIPGALLGVALLIWRAAEGRRRAALGGAAVTVAILAVAAIVNVGVNKAVFDRPALGGGVENAANVAAGTGPAVHVPGLAERVSYTWQLYLPRLPFMNDQFTYYPLRTTFLDGTIGRFGWLDTVFPSWVYTVGLVVALGLLALLAVALVQRRRAVLRRLPELVTYAVMVVGLLASIGILGLRFRLDTGFAFEQARYLLPFLPLYAAAVVLAARAVGRQWERSFATVLVVLAMAHGLFGMLLVTGRFYG